MKAPYLFAPTSTIRAYIGLLGIFILLGMSLSVLAAPNLQINYQGKLTTSANVAVANGTYLMAFNLYTASSSGVAIWTETRSGVNRVTVTNGLFSVMLGSVNSLSGVNFDQTLYLGVTIEADAEMAPRKILGTVPAAFEANNAATVGGVASTSLVRNDQATTITASTSASLFSIIQNGTGDIFNLFDGGTKVFTVLDGGNIGIGTSTPAARLQILSTNQQFRSGYDATNYLSITTGPTGTTTFNATGTSPAILFTDNQFELADESDPTKRIGFQLSGITTGTKSLWTFPAGTATFVGANLTQTLSNKTISAGTFTGVSLFTGTSTLATTTITDLTLINALALTSGGTGATTAAGARTNLGATTVGANIFTLTNPSALSFLRINADNTVSAVATSTLGIALSDTTGVLAAIRGGTGLSTITQNELLIGGAGNTWSQVATSSLGLSASFTTSAQLAALLSDETGTGAAVFAGSPLFTGTAGFVNVTATGTLAISGTSTFSTTTMASSTITNLNVIGSTRIIGGANIDTLTFAGSYGSIIQAIVGSSTGFTNFSGGIGTGGTDSIATAFNNALRITNTGNLVNIGAVQGGELNLTRGGTFASKVDYTTGDNPLHTTLGDVNGDGKADIVTANYNGTSASVFINNGSGTFATKVDYTTGNGPAGIALGDINGDGRADMVLANYFGTSASVLINNGNGTFATKVDYTTGSSPVGVALGDVNADGKADMVVANSAPASVSVFLNTGNGTFAAKVDYTAGANTQYLALGDVNGDGKADIVTANFNAANVSVFINNGNGTFATKVDYTTGLNPYGIALGDINGDNRSDIVVSNNGSTSASVLMNNGNGTFATKVDYTTGATPRNIALGDVSGDGKPDMVVASNGATVASIFINNGNGTFATKVDYTTGASPYGIALGDVNADGKADMVTTNFTASTVSVFFNNALTTLFAQTSTGNVGVGTSTPNSRLLITGNSGSTQDIFSVASSTNVKLFTVSSDGNVGIGSTTPSSKLTVGGNAYFGGNITATGTLAVTGTSVFTGTSTFSTTTIASSTITTLNLVNALALTSGGTGATTAAGARTNLGATTVGANIFTLTNPSALSFLRINADNTVSAVATSTLGIALSDTTGVLAAIRGGTGLSTITQNELLIGGAGNTWSQVATSSLGLSASFTTSAGLAAILSDESGTGFVAFTNSPAFTTPDLGTPSTLVGTNITGTASGLTAGNVTTNANLTGMITSIGNAASLGSFTSSNLLTALTDETGTGNSVFSNSPTFTGTTTFASTTIAGSFQLSSLTAARGLFLDSLSRATTTGISQNLIDSITNETGTGSLVFSNAPTFSGNVVFPGSFQMSGTSFTRSGNHNLTLTTTATTNVTLPTTGTLYGTLASSITSADLLSSVTDETGTGALVFAGSPLFTGTAGFVNVTATGTLAILGTSAFTGTSTFATTTMASSTITTLNLINALALTSGGTGATTAAGARTNLGATTVGSNIFTLTNPSALSFLRINADNTVSAVATSTLGIALSDTTGILAATRGGTGLSSYATGDLIYASGANTLANRTIGTTGDVLSVVSGVPTWVATSTLGITGGGSSLFTDGGATTYLTSLTDNFGIGTTSAGTVASAVSSSTAAQQIAKFTVTNGDAMINTLTLGFGGGQITGNQAVGFNSLYNNTTGYDNTAVGYQSLFSNTTGYGNTAFGPTALYSNTTGLYNIAIGRFSLYDNTDGYSNVAIGDGSLNLNTTGRNNTAIGHFAIGGNRNGYYNTAIGDSAGYDINTATSTGANTIVGYNTGRGIVTGVNNTVIGANVSGLASSLSNNIIIADGAGNQRINVGSTGNVGIGSTTPSAKLTVGGDGYFGGNLTATGTLAISGTSTLATTTITNLTLAQALAGTSGGTGLSTITQNQLLIGGAGNTWSQVATSSLGLSAAFTNSSQLAGLLSDETGSAGGGLAVFSNAPTFTGTVLASAATLSSTLSLSGSVANIALGANFLSGDGDDEGVFVTSAGNVGIGTTTPTQKLSIVGSINIDNASNYMQGGKDILYASSTRFNFFGGEDAGRLLKTASVNGTFNTAIGYQSMFTATSSQYNTAVGFHSLNKNTSGGNNTAQGTYSLFSNTSGNYNTASGDVALYSNTTGSNNTTFGSASLYSNTTGSNNTTFGYASLYSNTVGSNNTALGFQAGMDINTATGTGANTIIGYNTGRGITTGINNTILGANVTGLAATLSNNIILADGQGNQRINVGSTGNVGIGSTTPASKLTVGGDGYFGGNLTATGTLAISGTSTLATTTVTNLTLTQALALTSGGTGATTAAGARTNLGATTVGANIFTLTNPSALSFLRINADNTVSAVATSTLGIALSDTTGTLTVNRGGTGAVTLTGLLQGNGTGAVTAITGTAGQFAYYGGASTLAATSSIFLATNGNFGVGTTSPNSKLTVAGGINIDNGSSGLSILGQRVLYASSTNFSTILGIDAGTNLNGADVFNTAIGYAALASATSSNSNTAIGYAALNSNTAGYQNTAVGGNAMISNTTGISNNAFGVNAMRLNIDGSFNTAFGNSTLYNNISGMGNTAIGYNTMAVNTIGSNNVGIGSDALSANASGTQNTAIGISAGSTLINNQYEGRNTLLGYNTGAGITTGINNTIIGANVTGLSATLANNIILADGDGNQRINVGSTGNVGIGSTTPSAKLTVGGAGYFGGNLTATGTLTISGTSTLATTSIAGLLQMGTTSVASRFNLDVGNFATAGTAGLNRYYTSTNAASGTVQFGELGYVRIGATATTTMVGSLFRIEDSTTFANTIRGFEVQTNRGTNTRGENTALSGFARTFGVRGFTSADAGGVFEPAGGYFETGGTTQGNAIRGYSSTITSASLASLFQDTSAFTGNGLIMNLGNGTGSFTGKFMDLQVAGATKFNVASTGTLFTLGDISLNATNTDPAANNVVGMYLGASGFASINRTANPAMNLGRTTDGAVLQFYSAGAVQGSVSIAGATVSYNAFTGSHFGLTNGTVYPMGTLLALTGENESYNNNTESEILYGMTESTTENSPLVIGSYLSVLEPIRSESVTNPTLVMAVGNGAMWVADQGENITRGDYLISSNVAGHAERDPQTEQVSNIIARASEDIDWSSVTEEINGVKHKRITVFFENFTRTNINLALIASSTVELADIDSDSVTGNFMTGLFGKLTEWFSNAQNGIGDMYANVFNANERICVDGECLTADDIRNLKDAIGAPQSPAPSTPSSSVGGGSSSGTDTGSSAGATETPTEPAAENSGEDNGVAPPPETPPEPAPEEPPALEPQIQPQPEVSTEPIP